jgi:hypothetical protein
VICDQVLGLLGILIPPAAFPAWNQHSEGWNMNDLARAFFVVVGNGPVPHVCAAYATENPVASAINLLEFGVGLSN